MAQIILKNHLLHNKLQQCNSTPIKVFCTALRFENVLTLTIELVQVVHRVCVVCQFYTVHVYCICYAADSASAK